MRCEDKHAYDSYKAAKKAAVHLAGKHKAKQLRSYQCNICEMYHLTSQPLIKESIRGNKCRK